MIQGRSHGVQESHSERAGSAQLVVESGKEGEAQIADIIRASAFSHFSNCFGPFESAPAGPEAEPELFCFAASIPSTPFHLILLRMRLPVGVKRRGRFVSGA